VVANRVGDQLIAATGRVEMWRGGSRLNIFVSAPFLWRCLSGPTITPFPIPLIELDGGSTRPPAPWPPAMLPSARSLGGS
jgi:hypothetical protein